MASLQSKLEAEKLAIINSSLALKERGRSKSPNRSSFSGTSLMPAEEYDQEVKWSIINHDPLERIVGREGEAIDETWENEASEEEHISDNDNEKFTYDDTGSILPNYACQDEKITEISSILENSNLNDSSTVKRLEQLTASERGFANARSTGNEVDENALKKLESDKQELAGLDKLDLTRCDQNAEERRQKLEQYSQYRRRVIDQEKRSLASSSGESVPSDEKAKETDIERQRNLKGTTSGRDFMVPYTSAVEDKMDSEFASMLNETIEVGEASSNKAQSRVLQVITRGNFFQLISHQGKPRMFVLCLDFSPESIFALEWCLGTVLVDGSVLFVICVIEDTDTNNHLKGNSSHEASREKKRLNLLNRAKQQVLNLLKLTKLQIHIVIEVIHHPIPRHLILEVIEHLKPTLVIVGSKGQSAIKGVLLGSLSNYLVTKLPYPVMVVREKLKKINKFKSGAFVYPNNIKPLTLSEARID